MSQTFLNVSFKDKERAKFLGARWDPIHKKWYVPENIPLKPFAEWCPPDVEIIISEPPKEAIVTYPIQEGNHETKIGISLAQLLSRVSQVLVNAIPRAEWIKAEVSECQSKLGHFYLDLVEFDANHQLLCKAKAIIFKSRLPLLSTKFQAVTGGFLVPGMKVLLQVKANFSIQHGFSLSIEDIDPNYTLGDMAANLAQIREQLQKEGIFRQNRQLNSPKDFSRIAVISPVAAAGLGDFQREAARLERLELCHFHYYTAQFQGPQASKQISSAIETVIHAHARLSFDALVILHGGGAVIDLAWLNDYAMAKQVCNCPFAVFTGIGHERDNTILDEVASISFDTPSKVIAYVFNRITDNAQIAMKHAKEIKTESDRLDSLMQHLIFERFTSVTQKVEQDLHQVQRLMEQFYRQSFYHSQNSLTLVTAHLQNWFYRLDENSHFSINTINSMLNQYWQSLQGSWLIRCTEAVQKIEEYFEQLKWVAYERQGAAQLNLEGLMKGLGRDSFKVHLQIEKNLTELMNNIMGLGPASTLQRGYALIRNLEKNQVVTSKAEAQTETILEIEFHDGCLNVRPI